MAKVLENGFQVCFHLGWHLEGPFTETHSNPQRVWTIIQHTGSWFLAPNLLPTMSFMNFSFSFVAIKYMAKLPGTRRYRCGFAGQHRRGDRLDKWRWKTTATGRVKERNSGGKVKKSRIL